MSGTGCFKRSGISQPSSKLFGGSCCKLANRLCGESPGFAQAKVRSLCSLMSAKFTEWRPSFVRKYYLMDPAEVEARVAAVAAQASQFNPPPRTDCL
eukprot:138735-Amphidinium_carterae.1